MLTLEQIKQGCEFADGFEYNEDRPTWEFVRYINKSWMIDYNIDADAWVYDKYSDFLQKVRRGINKDCMDYSIDIDDEFLRLKDTYGDVIEDFYDNDEHLEEAIIYVLNKMGEKNDNNLGYYI